MTFAPTISLPPSVVTKCIDSPAARAYQAMRKVTGKQMKTVWRKPEFDLTGDNGGNRDSLENENEKSSVPSVPSCSKSENVSALAIFPDSINGSRRMADVPQIETERIYHETKFVFLACRAGLPRRSQAEAGATADSVVHTTLDVSLPEAWAKTPNGKKRETTHVVRCETEIFRVKS